MVEGTREITAENENDASDNCLHVKDLETNPIRIDSGRLSLAYCHSVGYYSLGDVMSTS